MTDNKAPERITAWINKDGSTQFAGDKLFPSNVEVEYVRADLRPTVKPLEWVGDAAAEVWTKAVTQIGTYFICDDTDDFSGFYVELISHDNAKWWQHVRSTGEMILDCHHDDDISPLKAAAEADYERRILSALDLAPVTPEQAAKDALISAAYDIEKRADEIVQKHLAVSAFNELRDVAKGLRAIAEGGA